MSLFERLWTTSIVFYSIFVCLFLYGLSFEGKTFLMIRIVLIVALVALGLSRVLFLKGMNVWLWWKNHFKKPPVVWWQVYFLGCFIVGFAIMGNLFVGNDITRQLFTENPAKDIEVYHVEDKYGELSLSVFIKDSREKGAWNQHSSGLNDFLSYYGGVFVLALWALFLYMRAFENQQKLKIHDYVLFEVFLLSIMAVPFFLFMMDFVHYGIRTWVQSRFLEIPVFCIVFIALYASGRFLKSWGRYVLAGIIIIYTLTPFMANNRPQQIIANEKLFHQLQKVEGM